MLVCKGVSVWVTDPRTQSPLRSAVIEAQHCDGNAMTLVRLRVKESGISFEVNNFFTCAHTTK